VYLPNRNACFPGAIIKAIHMKMTLLAVLTLTAWVETAFPADTPPPAKTIGINPAYRNLSVKPGDDFEEYANGGWRKTAEIPADRASTGASI
jgi:putative endopeptidase